MTSLQAFAFPHGEREEPAHERRQFVESKDLAGEWYRVMFDGARIALWIQDFSTVLDFLDELRSQGIADICSYFQFRPQTLMRAISLINVRDVNNFAVELFEADHKQALCGPLSSTFQIASEAVFISMLAALWEGRRHFESDSVSYTLKGKLLYTQMTVDWRGQRCEQSLVSLQDISKQKASEQFRQQLAAIVESSDDAIVSKDLCGMITSWNKGAEQLFGYAAQEVIGKPVTILIPPDRQEEEPRILERIHRGERVEHYETVRQRKDGGLVHISLTVSPIRDSDGNIVGASKIARDITTRKEAEAQRDLLMAELNHRVKNTLATVVSIARQSFKTATATEEALRSFEGRIHALSQAHDRLTKGYWSGVRLESILQDELSPYLREDGNNVRLSGPPIRLNAKYAIVLGMAFHELATNATKYGALSRKTGIISVTWDVARLERLLRVVWVESGGPSVVPPQRSGFGRLLVERALASDLKGKISMDFDAGGLRCVMAFPFEEQAVAVD